MKAMLTMADLDKVKQKSLLLDDPTVLGNRDTGYSKMLALCNGPTDALEVWSRPHPSGVYEYIVLGRAPVRARVMFDVLMDDAYHTEWDNYCSELRRLHEFNPPHGGVHHSLNYWVVKYPTPLRKRDYVYERLAQRPHKDGDGKGSMYYFATQAVKTDKMPEVSGHIRVSEFKGSYCLREATVDDLKPVCEYLYSAVDDPKGFIPKPIVNFISSKAIPASMQLLYKACHEYKGSTL